MDSPRLAPEATIFSGAIQPSFVQPEFKTATRDFYNIINFSAPSPASYPAIGDYSPSRSAEGPREGFESHSPFVSSRPPKSRRQWNHPFTGLSRFFRSLVHRIRPPMLPDASMCLSTGVEGGVTTHKELHTPSSPLDTPASSGSPSSCSSQDDITVSSVEDRDPRLLQSPNLTTPEVYLRGMSKSGKGLACWKPGPRKPYSGERGTVPGDVGTFSAEGGFKKIFNLWDDEESMLLSVDSSDGMSYRLPQPHISVELGDIPQGSTITEGASSDTIYSESDGRRIASFQFRCHSRHGAVLAATSSADLEELTHYTELRRWIIQHAALIYQHANNIRQIATVESLYIITGCIKSDSWALAAFEEVIPAPYDLMCLENMTCDTDQSARYAWTRRATSEARFGSSDTVGLKDQTLFLRGFKLDFSQAFRNRMEHAPHTFKDDKPGHERFDPSDGSRPPRGSEGPSGSKDAGEHGGSGSQADTNAYGSSPLGGGSEAKPAEESQDAEDDATSSLSTLDSTSFSCGVSVESIPYSPQDTCHPSDAINRYLLDKSGADFALCHDDEWRFAAEAQEGLDILSNIRAVTEGFEVAVRHGVAFLSSKDGHGDTLSHPSYISSTVQIPVRSLSPLRMTTHTERQKSRDALNFLRTLGWNAKPATALQRHLIFKMLSSYHSGMLAWRLGKAKYPQNTILHPQLLSDITSGLAYLHRMNIIYGDLKVATVLVSGAERACITDFGDHKGTRAWAVPETFDPHDNRPSVRWDMLIDPAVCWFTCLSYEIIADELPFYDVTDSFSLMRLVPHGKRPSKPNLTDVAFTNLGLTWQLMESWCYEDPRRRPEADEYPQEHECYIQWPYRQSAAISSEGGIHCGADPTEHGSGQSPASAKPASTRGILHGQHVLRVTHRAMIFVPIDAAVHKRP